MTAPKTSASISDSNAVSVGCDALFVPDMPTSEGCYWMKCMENNQTPEWVAVYWLKAPKHGKLLVCDWDLGNRYPLKSVHDGLTDVTWAAALRVRTNTEVSDR
jgi:hypothetical protein